MGGNQVWSTCARSGCIIYVKNTKPNPKKLDDRSTKMVFVGYEKGSKAYRAYDPRTRWVHVTLNVVFDELAQWDWSKEDDAGSNNEPFEFMVTTTSTYHKQVVDHAEPELTPSSLTEQVPSPPPTPENIVHTMPPSI
jgi:hypothetical protein